jgi:heme-degrading monooxygenase HmoA
MVLEHAILDVRRGEEVGFEEAFATAKAIIAASPGFETLRLARCIEQEGRYVLLVEWSDVESHVIGFRGSPAYEEWRRLLHHFYDPFPEVQHYEDVVTVPRPP